MEQRQTSGKRLRKNHSNAIPRYIVALDTETYPTPEDTAGREFSHRLKYAVLIVGRISGDKVVGKKVYHVRTKRQIWQVIKQFTGANYTTWIVCHSTLFDMVISGMPEEFENGSITLDSPGSVRKQSDSGMERKDRSGAVCIESPPFILGARIGGTQGRIVILDTLNWFQCPLADLGRAGNTPKLNMPGFDAPEKDWFDYCQRDTEIVFNTFVSLIKWVKDNDMGMFRYTGPAQAMAAFRHRFKQHDILIHDNLPVKVIERSGYFGGRFECWKIGELNETIYQYDVNALFPSVMLGNLYPVSLDAYSLNTAYDSVGGIGSLSGLVAECELSTENPVYPYRRKEGVCFPVGKFKTTLCGPELEMAAKRGEVVGVRSYGRYKLAPIFDNWVTELWETRKRYKAEGNTLYERFVKMLMNSLYGKFGQRSPEWVNVPERCDCLPWQTWVEYDASSGERTVYRSFGWQVQKQTDREERHHAEMPVSDWESHSEQYARGEIDSSFIAIAAYVTAYARVRMNHLRELAGPENVYYQGVDSLIVNNSGKQRLQDSNQLSDSELGKLRLQMVANYGKIAGCSDYTIGDKIVLSGLSRSPQPQILGEQRQKTFAAKPYLFRGQACDYVIENNTDWRKQAGYWKGTVNQDGTVAPLVLG